MLKNALPKIKTETLPGPKAKELVERRKNIVPNAIGCVYPVSYTHLRCTGFYRLRQISLFWIGFTIFYKR